MGELELEWRERRSSDKGNNGQCTCRSGKPMVSSGGGRAEVGAEPQAAAWRWASGSASLGGAVSCAREESEEGKSRG